MRTYSAGRSLPLLAALFVSAGVICSAPIALPLISSRLSADGLLEAGTIRAVRRLHLSLLVAGAVTASLSLLHGEGARRLLRPARSTGAQRALFAGILFCAACTLYLPPYYAMSMLKDDPARYAFSALNILEGKGYVIGVNRQYYPAKDFPGYPLLIALAYRILGPFPGNAVYATLACALSALALTYAVCRRAFGGAAALLAMALLWTHPLFLSLGRLVRSEALSCMLLLSVVFLFMELTRREEPWPAGAVLLGALLGCGYVARPTILVALLALPAIFLASRGVREGAKAAGLVCAGAAPVVLPYLSFCARMYGGPFRSGYHVWHMLAAPPFSLRNIAMNISPRWIPPEPQNAAQAIERFLGTTNGAYYASSLLGLQGAYGPAVFMFILAGIAGAFDVSGRCGRQRRSAALAFLSVIGLYVLLHMTYVDHDPRYLFLVLPFLLSFAAYGASRRLRPLCRGRVTAPTLAWAALFAFAASGMCLSLAREIHRRRDPPYQYVICEAYRKMLPPDGCVISSIHPAMLDRYLLRGTARRYYVVSPREMYARLAIRLADGSRVTLPVEPVQRHLDEVRAMLRAGKVVMADDWSDPDHPGRFDAERNEIFAGFAARVVRLEGPFRIYRLFPR